MEYDLEVYTSAPDLLQPSNSDLGIIAQTRTFPVDIARNLINQRYYSFLEKLPLDDPTKHPPRVIAGPIYSKEHYSVSYAEFSGADHTGRTTPTIHTATVRAELLCDPMVPIAQFLKALAPEVSKKWDGPPRWIDPRPSVSKMALAAAKQQFSTIWGTLSKHDHGLGLLARLAEGLLRFDVTSRPVLLVLPPEAARCPLDLYSDVLYFLPASIQSRLIFASHLLDKAEWIRGTSFGITYRDTAFYAHTKERHDPRRPLIIDPIEPNSFMIDSSTPYAQFLLNSSKGDFVSNRLQISNSLSKWDEGGFTVNSLATFIGISELLRRLSEARTVEDIRNCNGLIARLGDFSDEVRSHIEKASLKATERLCGEMHNEERAILEILKSSHWPASSRQHVAKVISNELLSYLPSIVSAISNGTMQSTAIEDLIQVLALNAPLHWPIIADFFSSRSSELPGIELSQMLLSASMIPPNIILDWLRDREATPTAPRRLCDDLRDRIRQDLEDSDVDKAVSDCFCENADEWRVKELLSLADSLPPCSATKAMCAIFRCCLGRKDTLLIDSAIDQLRSSNQLISSSQLLRSEARSSLHIDHVNSQLMDLEVSPLRPGAESETIRANIQSNDVHFSTISPPPPRRHFSRTSPRIHRHNRLIPNPRFVICALGASLILSIVSHFILPENRQFLQLQQHLPLLVWSLLVVVAVVSTIWVGRLFDSEPENIRLVHQRVPIFSTLLVVVLILLFTTSFLLRVSPSFMQWLPDRMEWFVYLLTCILIG